MEATCMYRIAVLISVFLTATVAIGCAAIRNRDADFSQFKEADRLRLSDPGPGADRTEKRFATVKDPRTIADVNAVLNSVAVDWQPVPWTPPAPRFTLLAMKNGQYIDWLWFDVPTGKERKAYVQMKLPHAGAYSTYISEANFDKLLKLFGVLDWRKDLDNQHDDGR